MITKVDKVGSANPAPYLTGIQSCDGHYETPRLFQNMINGCYEKKPYILSILSRPRRQRHGTKVQSMVRASNSDGETRQAVLGLAPNEPPEARRE